MATERKSTIRIGTRGSKLALWQAEWVRRELESRWPDITVEIVKIKTTGDKILDSPLAKIGGKGLFVKEIEDALLSKRVDLAVHSMKDVPTVLPEGLHLRAITRREDPRDVLVSKDGLRLDELAQGAHIGTSSLRRQCQLWHIREDFKISTLRGNLDTRLRKLKEGQYDAIILAGAGMRRLGFEQHITEYLPEDRMLPAIGQGALGIETRCDDSFIDELVSFLDHRETSIGVRAERAFLERLEGGCQVPIAAHAVVEEETVRLTGLVGSVDGKTIYRDSIAGDATDAERLGVELAERLLSMGADRILAELYGSS